MGRPSRDIESGVIDPLSSSNGAANDENNDVASIGACSSIGATNVYDNNDYNPNSIIIIDDDDDDDDDRNRAAVDNNDNNGNDNNDDDEDDDDDENTEIVQQSGNGGDEVTGIGRSLDYAKILRRRRKTDTGGSRRIKTLTNISSSTTKMTTRYRFRDLLLGDFSFNDDGER